MGKSVLFFFFLQVAVTVLDANPEFIFDYHYPVKFFQEIESDPHFESVKCLDGHYIGVKEKSLKDFLETYKKAAKLKKFKLESSDCDDFGLFFKFFSSFVNTRKKNNKYALCVGFALVKAKEEALGIPPTKAHAINLIWSDKGWIVVEPQSGEYCLIKDYPNEIKWVLF